MVRNTQRSLSRYSWSVVGTLMALAILPLWWPHSVAHAAVSECPFTSSTTTRVVSFPEGGRLLAHTGPTHHRAVVVLAPGMYRVKYYSYDEHEGREHDPVEQQRHEQWNLEVYSSDGSLLSTLGPTPDLADVVPRASKTGTFSPSPVAITATTSYVVVRHVLAPASPTNGPNSVFAPCVAFERVSDQPEPQPICPLSEGVVVPFGGTLLANRGEAMARVGPRAIVLAPGSYRVTLASYDAHSRKRGQEQHHEQWFVELWGKEANVLARTNPIDDLPDNKDLLTQVVESSLTLSATVTAAFAHHAAFPSANYESVTPLCASFVPLPSSAPQPEPQPEPPRCTLSLSPSSLVVGEERAVVLQWSSHNAAEGEIQPIVGRVTPVGSYTLTGLATTSGSLAFTGTFWGPGGTTTCAVSLVVRNRCTTCGGAFMAPRVVLAQRIFPPAPRHTPLGYVTLTQLPYTGVPLSPFMAFLVWSLLLLVSFALAWWLVVGGGRKWWERLISPRSPEGEGAGVVEGVTRAPLMDASSSDEQLSASSHEGDAAPPTSPAGETVVPASGEKISAMASPARGIAHDQQHPSSTTQEVDRRVSDSVTPSLVPPLERELIERAHAEKVLLSDEALAELMRRSGGDAEKARSLLEEFLTASHRLYPPDEGGWIPLNRDRVRALALATHHIDGVRSEEEQRADAVLAVEMPEKGGGDGDEKTKSSLPSSAHPSTTAPQHDDKPSEVLVQRVLQALVEGDEWGAWASARTAPEPRELVVALARALDSVLQARRRGESGGSLAPLVAHLSDSELAQVVETLVEGLDRPYLPAATAKLALAEVVHLLRSQRAHKAAEGEA